MRVFIELTSIEHKIDYAHQTFVSHAEESKVHTKYKQLDYGLMIFADVNEFANKSNNANG